MVGERRVVGTAASGEFAIGWMRWWWGLGLRWTEGGRREGRKEGGKERKENQVTGMDFTGSSVSPPVVSNTIISIGIQKKKLCVRRKNSRDRKARRKSTAGITLR